MVKPVTRWIAEDGTSVIGEYPTMEEAKAAECRDKLRTQFPTIYGDTEGCRLYFDDIEQWAKENPVYWAQLKEIL